MNEQIKLRDPTAESSPARRARLAPPSSLEGKTVALMDIGKSRGKEFIDRLEGHFKKAGIATKRYAKPTNTKVAPTSVKQGTAEDESSRRFIAKLACRIAGLGDLKRRLMYDSPGQ